MVIRTVKGLVQLLGGLGAGVAIIALLIAWQIHRGPISLSFLTPYVEQALNSGHRGFRLAIDDTTLNWAGWERTVELRVKNVRAVGDDGNASARIPELSMSLSGMALLRGELAPKYIELLGPNVRIRRNADGRFGVELAGEDSPAGGRIASGLLGWLMKKPDPGSPMSYLDTVRISGATVSFDDRVSGRVWEVPVGHFRLERAPFGLIGDGSILIDVEGHVADIALNGSFQTASRQLNMTGTFTDITPATFASLSDNLSAMRAVDLALSGTVVVGFSLDEGVQTVGFNVSGEEGEMTLPIDGAPPIGVERLRLRGLFNRAHNALVIDEANIAFAEETTFEVPAPISHTFPVTGLAGAGRYDLAKGVVDVRKFEMDLGGPAFSLKGSAHGVGREGPVSIKADAQLRDVLVNEVEKYWPQTLGSDAHAWVTSHLKDGVMKQADASIEVVVAADGTFDLKSLGGTMSAEGVSVTYMEELPPVTGASALMSFDESTFDIAAERGKSGKIDIAGGTIHISGLNAVDQYADIDIRIETPIPDGLRLIDHPPLSFASAMSIDPAKTGGKAEVDLNLRLLLAKDLTLDDVDVTAAATLHDVVMDDVVLGRGIRDGELTLDVDKKGMRIDGKVAMGAIPVALSWRENFQDDAPFRSRYVMSAATDDVRNVRDLGVDVASIAGDFVSGGAEAIVRYTVFDTRSGRIEVETDLSDAEIRIPMLDWRKPRGDSGRSSVTILLENGLVKSVPSFEVAAGDLSVKGDIVYSAGGLGLERVNLKQVILDRTRVSGAVISRPDGGWEVGLQGAELDFTPLWDRMIHDRPGQEDMDLPDITVAIELDKMWIDKQRFLTGVSGTFVRRQDIWRTVLLDSKVGGVSPLIVNLTPDDTGNRILTVRADDAGEALRFFDLFENMYGGKLEIRGRYDDAAIGRPLRGKLRVVNYRVRNAPLMTRILSIMALTGILDAMTGEGLNFAELDMPFTYREGEVQLTDAKATGASIGFTASGTVYTHADVLNIEGTVVPAYALNSLLGKIPLLGNLLTGTEDGGGIFAANFSVTGPMEDPKTTVNPLSALTPGILRNLFGALTETPGKLTDPEPERKPLQP